MEDTHTLDRTQEELGVSELLVLAAALGVSPAQLVYPDLHEGTVEVLPGLQQESDDALRWFIGEAGLMRPSSEWDEKNQTLHQQCSTLARTTPSGRSVRAIPRGFGGVFDRRSRAATSGCDNL